MDATALTTCLFPWCCGDHFFFAIPVLFVFYSCCSVNIFFRWIWIKWQYILLSFGSIYSTRSRMLCYKVDYRDRYLILHVHQCKCFKCVHAWQQVVIFPPVFVVSTFLPVFFPVDMIILSVSFTVHSVLFSLLIRVHFLSTCLLWVCKQFCTIIQLQALTLLCYASSVEGPVSEYGITFKTHIVDMFGVSFGREGETMSLGCTVIIYPALHRYQPEIQWYRDGKQMTLWIIVAYRFCWDSCMSKKYERHYIIK